MLSEARKLSFTVAAASHWEGEEPAPWAAGVFVRDANCPTAARWWVTWQQSSSTLIVSFKNFKSAAKGVQALQVNWQETQS